MASLYCQACFSACSAVDRCCDACGRSCSSACSACGRVCTPITECIEGAFCSPERPLPICACFTFGIQLVPAAVGVFILLSNFDTGCSQPLIGLSIFNIAAAVVNMIYAMHLFRAMTEARMDPVAARKSAFDRACDIFMYDKGVALYIPLAIVQVVFLFIGRNWLRDESECVGSDLEKFASISTSLLGAYLGLGILVIFFSTMVECCRHDAPRIGARTRPPRYDRSHPQHEAARPPPAQRKGLVRTVIGGVMGGLFGAASGAARAARGSTSSQPPPAAHGNPYNPHTQGGAPPSAPPASNPGYQPPGPPPGSSTGGNYSAGYNPQQA